MKKFKLTNMETLYWKTKDGRVMNVDDMSDTHVRNAFKMILRKRDAMQKAQEELMVRQNTIALEGDMANEFNNSMEEYELEFDPYAGL